MASIFDESYATTILVDQTPEQAFDAINDVGSWWSEDIEGSRDALGEEFTFRGMDIHYSRIEVAELVPGERVVWLVLDNHINFVEISKKGKGAEIRFSHLGPVPEYECFDVCSNAWAFFIDESLRSRIATGKGQPMEKDRGDAG